jgi:hypothetical protein
LVAVLYTIGKRKNRRSFWYRIRWLAMWIGWDMVDNVADTMGMRGCGCDCQKWLWLGEWQWLGGSVACRWKEGETAIILVLIMLVGCGD